MFRVLCLPVSGTVTCNFTICAAGSVDTTPVDTTSLMAADGSAASP